VGEHTKRDRVFDRARRFEDPGAREH
jgi:hypothetical protein